MGADWFLFWKQHFERVEIVDLLNGINIKWVWKYWVDWFGLEVEKTEQDLAIEAMHEKRRKMIAAAKKR